MGIAVAGATYSVNIELNHQSLNKQLDDLGTKVQGIGKKAANKASGTKQETDTLRKQNNILASNAREYGKALVLNRRGKDVEEKRLNYQAARFAATQKNYGLAKDLISENRKSNAYDQNEIILKDTAIKKEKVRLKAVNDLNKARHTNFNLRSRLDDLDNQGIKVDKLRLKYGNLNTAQGKRDFNLFKDIGSQLNLSLKKEERKLRILGKQTRERLKQLRYSQRMGGATSPIRGDAIRDVGSPAWIDRSARMGGPSSKLNYQRGHLLPGPVGTGGHIGAGSKVWQSAAISGAFPLLFGQGPVTAAAGAVGGGLGGKYGGQMGGFAGGLAATAAISTVGTAVNAVKELGQAMGPYVQDTDALITATGQANTFRAKEIELIKKLKGEKEAFNEAVKDMTKLVGQKGVDALKQFGEDTKRLAEDWQRFMTQMGAGLARLINWSGLLGGGTKSIARRREELAGSDTELYRLQQERKDILTGFTGTRAERKAALDQNMEDTRLRLIEYDKEQLERQDKKLAKYKEEEEAIKRLDSLYKDIGGTIKDGLVQGIQAAIDGTKSLGEIAGSVFRKISDALLDFGVSMALSNLPIPGAKKFFGFANGGRPPKGRPSIVGERGPELFVPDSAGTVIPNHEMGGANIVVNVDASGSAVQGDGGQAEELGSMLGAAVQAELVNQQRPGGLLAGTR